VLPASCHRDRAIGGPEHRVDPPADQHTGDQQLERSFDLQRHAVGPRGGEEGGLQGRELTVVRGALIGGPGQVVDVEQLDPRSG
jgi:hypothetical protein